MSKLQLNEPVQDYREFYGRITEQMPKLIADGRALLSVSGLRRLEARNASELVKDSWLYNYFDTGDAIAYHPDGMAKIVLDSQLLRELTPESKLINGALIIPNGMYEALEGLELSRGDLEKYASKNWLNQKEVISNPVWQALARDKDLLKEYAGLVFSQGYDDAMGICRASPQDIPTMRSWCVGRLDGIIRSGAYFRDHLDLDGRLVGVQVVPKAQK
ncbi:hypothetical protein HYV89_01025 [Candidatus Woesearchaeota archaeon]|nr:hypothetical protein [Candidatus Woesearchaeota archaeon]